MSALNPLFLAAAAIVAVPLVLHLFHRQESRRLVFPALRYLLRTEKDHARRIRLRQLLLLLVRVGVILLVVGAGARLFVRGQGGAHEPTALAIILDNSLSSARIVDDRRVLDLLRERALDAVARAGPDDRIWVIRAGEPWDVALPLDGPGAVRRIRETEATDARGDLGDALVRAAALVRSEDRPGREIHLLSDLQRSAFSDPLGGLPPAGDIPVIVFRPDLPAAANHYVRDVTIGGGSPPLSGQRTEVAVTLATEAAGPDPAGDREGDAGGEAPLPIRISTGDRIRAAGEARAGFAAVLPLGPFPGGWVSGHAETDPDALRGDDRRYFAFQVRPPVPVQRSGDEAFFLDEALRVLEEAGRIRLAEDRAPDVVVTVGGAGVEAGPGATVLVVPPSDPSLLPGLNRRLGSAGIPWRYGAPTADVGETSVEGNRAPPALSDLRITRHYRIESIDESLQGTQVATRLSTGDPLLVSGRASAGPFVLLAVPFDPGWSDLPLSAAMIPLLEWAVSRRGEGTSGRGLLAGEELPTPPGATAVRSPDGELHAVGGARGLRATGAAGIYEIVAADTVLEVLAVNPPLRESQLAPVRPPELPGLIGPGTAVVDNADEWAREVFRRRQGPELWRPLVLAALLLLLFESWIAASGRGAARPVDGHKTAPAS